MRLVEYSSPITTSSRVDRDAGIIRDVLILGQHSANGRTYTSDALIAAAPLYEGVAVYIDHQPERRSYRDKIGRLVHVQYRDGGLRGDLCINPAHPAAPQLMWDAENHPAAVGLSHDATGRTVVRDGHTIVEAIESVRSVDLVAEPATTRTLYEDRTMPDTSSATPAATPQTATPPDPLDALYQSLTLEDLASKRPDLLEALRRQIQAEIATPMQELRRQLDELKSKLDEYMTAEQADQQMAEARLDPARVPPRLREAIRRERDRTRRAALIEEVRRLTTSGPVAASGWPTAPADITARITAWRV